MRVVLGRVAGAHGVQGEVRIRFFGDGPENLLEARAVWIAERRDDPAARRFEVKGGGNARPGEVRLALRGIDDREAAQALRGSLVLVDAADLPALPDGDYYWYELVGCRVESKDGAALGTVRELLETGAHDVLVVEDEDGHTRLIPTAAGFLGEIDVANRRIVVEDLPGLLDPALES